ncbi:MAG: strawberry notch family protein [Proteobacteria bacterium]|nr:strawberry notch family protein [Pseudomonadota bacterium]
MDSTSLQPRVADAPLASPDLPPKTSKPDAVIAAGRALLPCLERGQKLDAAVLRTALEASFGGSDSEGKWQWKDSYDAAEIALVLFLGKHLHAIEKRASNPAQALSMLKRVQGLVATHTKRSEESVALQQFSTPVELAYLVERAAGVKPSDLVLEPSAGTGLLAVFARARKADLMLNELADTRAAALSGIFPDVPVTRHNAEFINDLLTSGSPSVVIMNPPFSASPHVKGRLAGIDVRHVRSAFARLAPGGRLVCITSAQFDPWETLKGQGTVLMSVALSGDFFKPHGTAIETRLSVIDKSVRFATGGPFRADIPEELLELISTYAFPRLDCTPVLPAGFRSTAKVAVTRAVSKPQIVKAAAFGPAVGIELDYAVQERPSVNESSGQQGIYETYRVERVAIPGAKPHPDKLVQSAAMASVTLPTPSYRPHVTADLVGDGLLSDAQLETLIYAGDAHEQMLKGHWLVDETRDAVTAANANDPHAVQFRRGYFLGDGTGVGKGRQVAGIVLDNWLKGRRRALWISKSDKLLEDAQRDWSALGMEKLLVVPLERYKQGTPVTLDEGILFTTYATLRSCDKDGGPARLNQILNWLRKDFDGAIIFDEAHAMANAAGGDSDRGFRKPSQQGIMGLRLQNALPDARVVYVSATGATTVENLAYAQRLGLWGSDDLPFNTRDEFVAAMLDGGIAAMEVVARDLKSLGLYTARSLTYEGVEVELLVHDLTPQQVHIYDAFAGAYQIIHSNLQDAMTANGITSEKGVTQNPRAKAAAMSAFEGSKQRLFANLLLSMKMPSLLKSIEDDIARGDAVIVQLVTTSEALLHRRLDDIPVEEWGDLEIDITPREYIADYLRNSFPTKLYETHTDLKGNKVSELMLVDGNPVECQQAVAQREMLLERLQSLPPLQSALDQLIQHFGTDKVAEVTGRSRRIVKKTSDTGIVLAVDRRSGTSNLAEAQAFMDDEKRILVFSDAGGTGRSYHADLNCRNQRQRVHYLLEAGWKADTAIQGLGRSNRTNQKQPPRFRPVTTNVKGERRFISTIARRLDSLGAITRGERKTGGQGLFRAADNLENDYAWAARRALFRLLVDGKVACCPYQHFIEMTGLKLTDEDGTLRDDLPPMHTLLNRMLALPITLQNDLFEVLEGLIQNKVDAAIAAGTFDVGLENITAESLKIVNRSTVATHVKGATTAVYEVLRKHKPQPMTLADVLFEHGCAGLEARFLYNPRSKRVALEVPTVAITLDDGAVQERVRLYRPMESHTLDVAAMADTYWETCARADFTALWEAEIAALPPFTESTFHVMTGLLLPLWKRLPVKNPRVYRFVTDTGERVIGRLLPAETAASLTGDAVIFNAADAWRWLASGMALTLEENLTLKKRLVMHLVRYEISGFNDGHVGWLKAQGCMSEIISYRLRVFVPTGEEGPAVLDRILKRYPHRPTTELEQEQINAAGGIQ